MKTLKHTTALVILLFLTSGFIFAKKATIAVKKAVITFYAHKYNGRKTALGEIYRDTNLTCATTDKKYLGHKIKFWNNSKSIIVKCNDLMAPDNKLRFDLTTRAFKALNNNSLRRGVMHLEFLVCK